MSYWESKRAYHVIQQPGEYAECTDVIEKVHAIIKPLAPQTVIDYGCGCGRLSPVFSNAGYVGYDVNELAIARARKANPNYVYTLLEPALAGDLFFAYTVLLHFPDDALRGLLKRIESKYVVIAEVMGRDWRRDGEPPVFNRDSVEYVCEMATLGRKLLNKYTFAHERYATAKKASRDITVLVFGERHGNNL